MNSVLPSCVLAALLTACGGSKGHEVETVPPSVLDPPDGDSDAPPTRIEYKLVDKKDTPYYPPPEGAYRTDSGLRFVVFERGESTVHPTSRTRVTVHYEGRTKDGTVFDSSIQRGEPASFVLKDVIPGWREGVKLMTVGDKFRFWIPEAEAYHGQEGRPQGELIFDVELIDMESE
jgi:peptidylprolyl isomerase